jgi:hypothetical protein
VVWLLGASFLTEFYLSDLRSFLMVVDYEKTVDSLQDMLDMHKNFYLPGGTSIELEFVNSNRPDFQQAYQVARQVTIWQLGILSDKVSRENVMC